MEHAFIVQLSLGMTEPARHNSLSGKKQGFNFHDVIHPCKLIALACTMTHRVVSESMR